MTSGWLVIGVSPASAFAFAMSSSLKHVSAGQVPDAQDLGARSLGRFIRATMAHPLWLGASAPTWWALVCGYSRCTWVHARWCSQLISGVLLAAGVAQPLR